MTSRIVSIALPSAAGSGAGTVERVPVLVRPNGVPYRMPLRWVVRQRRAICAESTIADNLRAIRILYAWLEGIFNRDPDDLLEPGFQLPTSDVDRKRGVEAFIRHLEHLAEDPVEAGVGGEFLARQAHSFRDFLCWCADPLNRGGITPVPAPELQRYRDLLALRLDEFVSAFDLSASRIEPLSPARDRDLRALIEPVRGAGGRFLLPFSFSDQNPFEPGTRLRNWLMYLVARDYGLRKGEMLTLQTSDIKNDASAYVLSVVRRPHAPDRRSPRPSVKRFGRDLPVPVGFGSAMRAYLTSPLPIGRRGAKTPFLFVTEAGDAMTWSTSHRLLKVLERRLGWPARTLRWHALRHTWAEDLAAELLDEDARRRVLREGQHAQAQATFWPIEILRHLGGWSSTSNMPAYYIQNVLRAQGARYFRARQERLWLRNDLLPSLRDDIG